VKFYLVLITLFLSNHVVCFYEEQTRSRRSHFRTNGMSMTIIMSYRASPRSGLFETIILQSQLPNDQIRRTWCMVTRGNVSKACILTLFETIWNCRKLFENNMSLKHAFWPYLKRFGTAENILKTMSLKHAFWQYSKPFGTAEKNENKVSKACTMTEFENVLYCIEKWKQCL